MDDNRQFTLWPANASAAYIAARKALADEEGKLLGHVERVADQRRALPMGRRCQITR